MHAYALGASRLWTYAALPMVAALLLIGAVLFGASGVANAAPVSFFDHWVGHDRSLQLSRDGGGTLTLGDGALNTDQWGVTWKANASNSITITLASLTGRSGPGIGNVGDRYIATIQPDSAGLQLLNMHRIGAQGQGYVFCTLVQLSALGSQAGA